MARASVDYRPNASGIRSIMKSKKVQEIVGKSAANVAKRAESVGSGSYGSRTRVQRVSAHGYAFTANFAAMVDNAKNDTLDKALGGAR